MNDEYELEYRINDMGAGNAEIGLACGKVYTATFITKDDAKGIIKALNEWLKDYGEVEENDWQTMMTPIAKRTMEAAKAIAKTMGDDYLSTTHIEIALMKMRILNERGIELNLK